MLANRALCYSNRIVVGDGRGLIASRPPRCRIQERPLLGKGLVLRRQDQADGAT